LNTGVSIHRAAQICISSAFLIISRRPKHGPMVNEIQMPLGDGGVNPCWVGALRARIRVLGYWAQINVYRFITHHSHDIRSRLRRARHDSLFISFHLYPDSLIPQSHSSTMSNPAGAQLYSHSSDISSTFCRRSTSPVRLHAPSKGSEFATRCSFTYVFTWLGHTFGFTFWKT
jgi:hypothetical protein